VEAKPAAPVADFLPASEANLAKRGNNNHGLDQADQTASSLASTPASMLAWTENKPISPAKTKTHDYIETIRKTVKQVGKEPVFVRVTPEEKQQLSSLVFAFNDLYREAGRKTSENEVGRIALNWLLADYQAHGQQSVLAQVLAALNA
jgi:hypothetical protein